jgi:hypothetical protein
MEEEEKNIKQKRKEGKKHALSVILDQHREPGHFMEALLIDNIDNVIDSIEKASRSADRLSGRISWLNFILAVIGALSLLVAGYSVFCK